MSKDKDAYEAFPMTRWSLVDQAALQSTEDGFQALENLVSTYLPALKSYLVYIWKMPTDRAEDFVQSFMASRVLQGDLMSNADQKAGKFRTYLLTSFKRFVTSEMRKENAQKRSPGKENLASYDEMGDVIPDENTSNSAFDRAWAREVLNQAIDKTREELQVTEREAYWHVFEARVVRPSLEGTAAPSYEELVRDYGFETPTKASNALITAKRIFSRRLQDVIREYVDTDEELAEELADLRAIAAGR